MWPDQMPGKPGEQRHEKQVSSQRTGQGQKCRQTADRERGGSEELKTLDEGVQTIVWCEHPQLG